MSSLGGTCVKYIWELFVLFFQLLYESKIISKYIYSLHFIELLRYARYYSNPWEYSSGQIDKNPCPHETYIYWR